MLKRNPVVLIGVGRRGVGRDNGARWLIPPSHRVEQRYSPKAEKTCSHLPHPPNALSAYTSSTLVMHAALVRREVGLLMDTNKPHAQSSPGGGKLLTYRRPSALRLFTLVFALVAGVTVLPGAMLSAIRANRVSSVNPTRPLTGLFRSPERPPETSPGSTQPGGNRAC